MRPGSTVPGRTADLAASPARDERVLREFESETRSTLEASMMRTTPNARRLRTDHTEWTLPAAHVVVEPDPRATPRILIDDSTLEAMWAYGSLHKIKRVYLDPLEIEPAAHRDPPRPRTRRRRAPRRGDCWRSEDPIFADGEPVGQRA